jgi:dUTP pyrophosphatase
MPQTVHFQRLPSYRGPDTPFRTAYTGDAGYDVFATRDFTLPPGARLVEGTGIALALPDGIEAQVRPKSGLSSAHGITVLNSPGTVDPPYRGEIGVVLYNANPVIPTSWVDLLFDFHDNMASQADLHDAFDRHVAEHTMKFKAGQKLAQLVFCSFIAPEFVEVEELPSTGRGNAGYGSSGR